MYYNVLYIYIYIRHSCSFNLIHWYPLSFHFILIHSVSLTFPNYPSIKCKTVWIRLANMKTNFKVKSVPTSPHTGLPSIKWKILENTESQWMCGASWPAAPWVGALMEGCSTSWLSTGYRVIWIDWAILGISWPFLATIGQSMPLYICHYMPLIFIHWISLISIVIPYRSDSFCIPHIPQLSLIIPL